MQKDNKQLDPIYLVKDGSNPPNFQLKNRPLQGIFMVIAFTPQ
jgi:hypothetical protein